MLYLSENKGASINIKLDFTAKDKENNCTMTKDKFIKTHTKQNPRYLCTL